MGCVLLSSLIAAACFHGEFRDEVELERSPTFRVPCPDVSPSLHSRNFYPAGKTLSLPFSFLPLLIILLFLIILLLLLLFLLFFFLFFFLLLLFFLLLACHVYIPHLPPPSPVTPPPCVFFIWMRANGPRRGWRNICLPSSVFGYKFFQPMGWLASPKTNPKRKTPKKSRAKLIMNLTRSLAKCMAMRWKPRDWLNQSLGAELRVEGRGNLNGLVCDSKTRST